MDSKLKNAVLSLLLLCGSFVSGYAQNWVQKGFDMNGNAGDEYGLDVSLSGDGTTMASGGRLYQSGVAAGRVKVYRWQNGHWSWLYGNLNSYSPGDLFGASVALSYDGNILAVGAPGDDGAGTDAGNVRVFQWDGMNWNQLGDDIDGEYAMDYSGWSISMSNDGSRVVIGAHANSDGGNSAGHTRVFEWDGTSWNQMGSDIDGCYDCLEGTSVDISGDGNTFVTGAFDGYGYGGGSARVFDWDGSNWHQKGETINGENMADHAGMVSISEDGAILAIGAKGNDGNGIDAGHVRIFEWDGIMWNQMGSDIEGENPGDLSGSDLSLSANGKIVAIGAQHNDGNGTNAGHVRVFYWDGVDWNQIGEDIDGEASEDLSGVGLSISADGSSVAIGAVANDGGGSNAGHVRVFINPLASITDEDDLLIKVYPNPVIDFLNIDLPFDAVITIMDLSGRTIYSNRFISGLATIEVKEIGMGRNTFESGVYLINIADQQGNNKIYRILR